MLRRKQANTPQIVAMETAVTDKIYEDTSAHDEQKIEFLRKLPEFVPSLKEGPRAGDNIMMLAEDMDHALISFAVEKGWIDASAIDETNAELTAKQVELAAQQIFGECIMKAGGSLANSFDAMVHSTIAGKSLVDGTFITAVGNDAAGDVFVDSLQGHIAATKRGRSMVAHVIPLPGNDRVIIATPSRDNPSDKYIDQHHLMSDEILNANTDMVMLGGYLNFVPHFQGLFNTALARIEQLNEQRAELGKPKIKLVLTAASQTVAQNPDYQAMFQKACNITDVIVHANTGEFRRLLGNDTQWREPHEHKWQDGDGAALTGHALEEAKKADADYQAAKAAANKDTIDRFAVPLAQQLNEAGNHLSFVVTNGSKGTYVVDANGAREHGVAKIDPSTIVNTVGAGDNFAAGYDLGVALGQSEQRSIELARSFAGAAIQQDAPRLDASMSKHYSGIFAKAELGGALCVLNETPQNTALLMDIKPQTEKQRA